MHHIDVKYMLILLRQQIHLLPSRWSNHLVDIEVLRMRSRTLGVQMCCLCETDDEDDGFCPADQTEVDEKAPLGVLESALALLFWSPDLFREAANVKTSEIARLKLLLLSGLQLVVEPAPPILRLERRIRYSNCEIGVFSAPELNASIAVAFSSEGRWIMDFAFHDEGSSKREMTRVPA